MSNEANNDTLRNGSLRNGEYLSRRVEDQIKWYDSKATTHKRLYFFVRLVEIVAAAAIPFLISVSDANPCILYLVSGLGVVVVVSAGMLSLFKYQDNWTNFRTTAETLRHHQFLYISGVHPYDSNSAFDRFVRRVENTISKEHSEWLSYVNDEKQEGGSEENTGPLKKRDT